jgi:hemoglobin
MSTKTLYERLGGYDAIVAVSGDLLPRLMSDSRLKRFCMGNKGVGNLFVTVRAENLSGPAGFLDP